jgi:hypothetical protein
VLAVEIEPHAVLAIPLARRPEAGHVARPLQVRQNDPARRALSQEVVEVVVAAGRIEGSDDRGRRRIQPRDGLRIGQIPEQVRPRKPVRIGSAGTADQEQRTKNHEQRTENPFHRSRSLSRSVRRSNDESVFQCLEK